MRILFIGDVVGRSGREAVATSLPKLRDALRIDLAVVNAENASHGFGLAPDMAETPRLIRALNYPPGTPGAGSVLVDLPGGRRVLVLQAMGRLYMDPLD